MNTENNKTEDSNKSISRIYVTIFVLMLGVALGLGYFLYVPETEVAQISEPVSEVTTESALEAIDVNTESLAKVVVYKSPTCNCCSKWVEHLEGAGFEVETHNRENMQLIKSEFGITRPLQSCHTAVVDGYTIEGHVPADDIKRLLKERLDVAGLTVPGMPVGSPGMEANFIEPYDVLSFDKQGKAETFAEYRVDGTEYVKNNN